MTCHPPIASGPAFRALLLATVLAALSVNSGLADELMASDDIRALPGVAFNQTLADMLPESVKSTGVLTVATDLTPPISFHDENDKLIGIDADLSAAMGVIFGLKVEMTDVGMGSAIVPSIQSKRFNISISGINDDPELEKQLDVIDYMYDATTIMVQKGNPLEIAGMDDLCGKKVAVPVGTFQTHLVEIQSDKCDPPIDILTIPKMPDVLQAVRSGRADATVNGYATSVYTTEHQTGNGVGLEALRAVRLAPGYLGMLVSKDEPELRDAIVAALQIMVDGGSYLAIMDKWGLAPLAIESVRYNDAANVPADQ